MKLSEKKLVSKERLVLGEINYMEVPKLGFKVFSHKNSHILMVFYRWLPDCNIYDYEFIKVIDWKPSPEE